MAGDWLKIEHATLDKPEVTLFSEMLGVPVDHGFGLLVRFWMWLDKNSCNGRVTHVSRMSIDTVMHTPGFGAALEVVGWLMFDEKDRSASVPNFNRHNGNSAKSRALTAKRVSKFRNDHVTHDGLPEKRERRVTPTNVGVVRNTKTVLQEPTAAHQALAEHLGVCCQAEFEKYRDHFAANGKSHKNEDAGFRGWLRRAAEFRPRVVASREPSLADKRAANWAAITGQVRHEREVIAERVGSPSVPALPGDLGEPGEDDVGGRTAGRAYRDVG